MSNVEATLRELYAPIARSSGVPVAEAEMALDMAVKSSLTALANFAAYDTRAEAYFLKRKMEECLAPLFERHLLRRELI